LLLGYAVCVGEFEHIVLALIVAIDFVFKKLLHCILKKYLPLNGRHRRMQYVEIH
jgi:nitrate reductase gamma subunit